MMNIYLKYDNMHKNEIFNALNFINNHVIKSISCMLSPLVGRLIEMINFYIYTPKYPKWDCVYLFLDVGDVAWCGIFDFWI